jgi:hypothetical protein
MTDSEHWGVVCIVALLAAGAVRSLIKEFALIEALLRMSPAYLNCLAEALKKEDQNGSNLATLFRDSEHRIVPTPHQNDTICSSVSTKPRDTGLPHGDESPHLDERLPDQAAQENKPIAE